MTRITLGRPYLHPKFESLEQKRPMTVDLSVSQSVTADDLDGTVELEIIVRNIGSETAQNASIRAELDEVFEEFSYTRASGLGPEIDGNGLRNAARPVEEVLPFQDFEGTSAGHGTLKRIGDINADGIADYARFVHNIVNGKEQHMAIDLRVVFGGDGLDPRAIDLDALDGTNGFVIDDFGDAIPSLTTQLQNSLLRGSQTSVFTADLNGDLIEDLVVSSPGDFVKLATTSASEHVARTGGAFVVYGSKDISTNGRFRPEAGNHAAFALTVPYFASRPVASAADVNRDGTRFVGDVKVRT